MSRRFSASLCTQLHPALTPTAARTPLAYRAGPARRFLRRSLPGLAALLLAAVAPYAAAHDSAEFLAARQAPFPGPVIVDPAGSSIAFTSSGITLLGWLPLGEFGSQTSGADCWGYTSPSGREYAIIGMSDAVAFVEVSDPGAPVILEVIPAVNSLWRDIKTYQDHAYWVSEGGGGVQIADMSQIDAGIVTFQGSVGDSGTSASHNLAIDETSGFLYRTGGGGTPVEGLRIFSLANPSSPQVVGEWNTRYVHDAQVVTYTSGPYAGKQVAFCFSEDGSGGGNPAVDILDVTNKNNIQSISQLTYTTPAFSHQGWLSPDRQHLYINDELDELTFGGTTKTRIANVSNLNAPSQVGTFTSGSTAIDHNLYTVGDLIFEANYRSGLRVFDASNPTAPVQTAWFDTYPDDDVAEFNGLWNAYPYLPSGTIVGSDLEKGLFLWKLGGADLSISLSGGAPELLAPGGQTITLSITELGDAIAPGSPALHYDTGAGFASVPLVSLGGGNYQGSFPGLDCGAQVTWYVSARTIGGTTYTDPPAAPTYLYGSVAAAAEVLVAEVDLESNPGWTVGAPGDTATTGVWERADPVGTTAQPEDDHTADPGTQCYVTAKGLPGGGLGDDDVDGGQTTLTTSDFDLSGGDATISYWRWYSNATSSAPNADVFVVDISNDGGATWSNVETVGPAGPETLGGWFQHVFLVSDLVTPTSQVRLRFVASDLNDGSIVEAAIDDLRVVRYECEVCQADLGFGGPGTASLSICGQALDSGNTADLVLSGAAPNALAVLFLGLASNPTPFKGGLLVPLPVLTSISLSTNGAGALGFPIPGGNGPFTVYAQFAIADGSQPKGAALSNALAVVFGP